MLWPQMQKNCTLIFFYSDLQHIVDTTSKEAYQNAKNENQIAPGILGKNNFIV